MNIILMVKQIGKRKPIIGEMQLRLPHSPSTLEELIKLIVTINVERFNESLEQQTVLAALTDEAIQDQAEAGKVSFGVRYNPNKQDVSKAVEIACLSFRVGLYKAFINEQEIEASIRFIWEAA